MIAELAINVEETFGIVATRLCRALHSKGLFRLIHMKNSMFILIRSQSSSISIYMLYTSIYFRYYSNCSYNNSNHSRISES
jgi:hypothetical protein